MRKDDEDFWIDYSKTIRIVQYNQYFVPFFSKNSRYIEAYYACTSKLAELLLDHPKEFNEKFNDVLKTISSLSSYKEQASKIYSVIDQVLAFFTELCEKVSIRKPGYSKILDDRGEVNIKIELSFVIKEGKEIIRVIDIIQQTEGLFANVSEELLYNEFNDQLDSRLEIRHTIPEIVITTDAYTSGNDDNAEDGAGGILSICNSVSVNSLDQKIMEELMQYKLNRLNIISIVQEESSIFRVKRLEFRRVPTGKEGGTFKKVCQAAFLVQLNFQSIWKENIKLRHS